MGCLSFKERMLSKMAESKNKQQPNGTAKQGRGQQTQQDQLGKFWQLTQLAKELASDVKGLNEYNDLLEDRKKLQKDLNAQNGAITQLKEQHERAILALTLEKDELHQEKKMLFNSIGSEFQECIQHKKKLQTCEEKADKQAQALQKLENSSRKQGKTNETLKRELNEANISRQRSERDYQVKEKRCAVLEAQLQEERSRCQSLQEQLALATDELGLNAFELFDGTKQDHLFVTSKRLSVPLSKNRRLGLKKIADDCHRLALEFFSDVNAAINPVSLAKTSLTRTEREGVTSPLSHVSQTATSSIRNLMRKFTRLPITIDTSREAVLMRCAAAEAVIAAVLATHIFRPFYRHNHSDGGYEAGQTLLDLCRGHSDIRAIIHTQLLRLTEMDDYDYDDGTRDGQRRELCALVAKGAMTEVKERLGELVPAAMKIQFEEALRTFFLACAEFWAEHGQTSAVLIAVNLNDLPTGSGSGSGSGDGKGLAAGFREGYGSRPEPPPATATGGAAAPIATSPADGLVTLFPRISILVEGEEDGSIVRHTVLHPGLVLLSDQAAVLVASEQVNNHSGSGGGPSSSSSSLLRSRSRRSSLSAARQTI
ncbi:hypothetical protein BX600DRAFT_492194 [Xylariales sp. PMI_506]|nr:hypothetical protein BX600DRAFT_492194 [Xylariales sp. PMI_506]